jgi:hypothetical protein
VVLQPCDLEEEQAEGVLFGVAPKSQGERQLSKLDDARVEMV